MTDKEVKPKTTRLLIEEPPVVSTVVLDLQEPPKGKAWRRKSDGLIFYQGLSLGTLYFMNGVQLEKPIKEKPEHFELIDTDLL